MQVYLDLADQERLERLQEQLDSSKSDVLRKGLEALERALTDPDHHPALKIIGIAGGVDSPEEGAEKPGGPGYDVAREHDRFLADAEVESWAGTEGGGDRG